MFAKLIAVVLPLLAAVAAANHQVVVGGNGTLTFNPLSLQVPKGDNVTFVFVSKNHSLQQNSFTNPCVQLPNGLQAPFKQVVAQNQTDNFPTITIAVKVDTPLWISCPQREPINHCKQGMVFSINPTPDKTAEQFQQNAINFGNSSSSSVSSTGSGTDIISSSPSGSDGSSSNSSSGPDTDPNGDDFGDLSGAAHYKVSTAMGLLAVVASGMLLL